MKEICKGTMILVTLCGLVACTKPETQPSTSYSVCRQLSHEIHASPRFYDSNKPQNSHGYHARLIREYEHYDCGARKSDTE